MRKKENRLSRLFGECGIGFVSEDAGDQINQHTSEEKGEYVTD